MMAEERERERAEDGGKRRKMAFSGRAGAQAGSERTDRGQTCHKKSKLQQQIQWKGFRRFEMTGGRDAHSVPYSNIQGEAREGRVERRYERSALKQSLTTT